MMYSNKLVASIKHNGNVMREHGDIVYLPFGSDYSIYLKNLNTVKAQVFVTVDGQDILDGNSLIIGPNESIDLKRWLLNDDMKTGPKLRFIEKSDSIRETRGEGSMDGIIEISYQFEYVWPVYGGSGIWTYNDTTLYGSPRSSIGSSQKGSSISNMSVGSSVDGVKNESTTQAFYSANITHTSHVEQEVQCRGTIENEDGMTVKGADCKQEFKTAHIGMLDATKYKIVLQLRGDVNQEKVIKAITVKTKITCSDCHKRQSSNNKFCTNCGSNLKYSK